jgi:hypothetical protein
VKDGAGQGLAYVYYEDEPGRRTAAKMLSKDEARRIVANIALGIESDDVVNYTFPKSWPADREQRARCSSCDNRGATIQHPGWGGNDVGFRPCRNPRHPSFEVVLANHVAC